MPSDMRAAGAGLPPYVLFAIPIVMTEYLLYLASMNNGSIGGKSTLKTQHQLQERALGFCTPP